MEGLQEFVASTGWAAPVVFVVVYAVGTVLLVPGAAMTALAGVLFGPLVGTGLVVVGATAGATAAFVLSRRLGRARIQRFLGPRLTKADGWLERRGFATMLGLRLVPLVPFNVLNYAAGLSRMATRPYVGATALGIVPGAFAYASLGGTLDDPLSARFLGAVALVVALAVAGTWGKRFLSRSAVPAPTGGDGQGEQRRGDEQQRER
ncbi:MAG: TVP38/TMEM64 family protein [Egibacteraceae bacterium]